MEDLRHEKRKQFLDPVIDKRKSICEYQISLRKKRKQMKFMMNRIQRSKAFSEITGAETPEKYKIIQEVKQMEPSLKDAVEVEDKIEICISRLSNPLSSESGIAKFLGYLAYLGSENTGKVAQYLTKTEQLNQISIFFNDYKNEELVYHSSLLLLNLLSTSDIDIMDILLESQHNIIKFLTSIF